MVPERNNKPETASRLASGLLRFSLPLLSATITTNSGVGRDGSTITIVVSPVIGLSEVGVTTMLPALTPT